MRFPFRLTTLTLLLFLLPALGGTAGATNYAGLVVRHGDGSVITRCVAFAEPSISGIELLYRSGLSVDAPTSGYGASVYGIDGEGTAEDWSSGRASWSYWHLRGGWVFSPVGASSYSVEQGDVEGWSWGPQTSPTSPPVFTFDDLYRDAYGSPPITSAPPAAEAPTSGGPAVAQPTNTTPAGGAQTAATAAANGSAGSKIGSAAGVASKTATATVPAGSRSRTTTNANDVNPWNYAAFGALLAGLTGAFVYYWRRNRTSAR